VDPPPPSKTGLGEWFAPSWPVLSRLNLGLPTLLRSAPEGGEPLRPSFLASGDSRAFPFAQRLGL